jgi:hypothetical protein
MSAHPAFVLPLVAAGLLASATRASAQQVIPAGGGVVIIIVNAPPASPTPGAPGGGPTQAKADDLARRLDVLEKQLAETEKRLVEMSRMTERLVAMMAQMQNQLERVEQPGKLKPPEPKKEDEKVQEEKAKLKRQSILTACEAYSISTSNPGLTDAEKMPTTLTNLVQPPFGGTSFLRNGEKDLLDPWGKMFQYAVVKDEKGELRAYVWTERTVDGKTKVIGTKPPDVPKQP